MSGGVDSSVAAALLVEQGYQVIGMMLRLWSEKGREADNRCCTPESMAIARRIAAKLNFPFYVVDAQSAHYEAVVGPFIEGYSEGITPNPCLACNQKIRWGFLLDRAQALGAKYLATGHYARVQYDEQNGFTLLQAVDLGKDQSYVLHVLNQAQLRRSLFPLGELTKSQVRQLARNFDLPVSERLDSQDLCFLGGQDYRSFLIRNSPKTENPGVILDLEGREIGQHRGLAFYTIGQRKGLNLQSTIPLHVISKHLRNNSLTVGPASSLGDKRLVAGPVNWISGKPPSDPFRAQIKIRYKAAPAWATVLPLPDQQVEVLFDQPLRDITPGQAAVIYLDNLCLGGGLILPANRH
jgi:tRNA-specific 2-thiouridylase